MRTAELFDEYYFGKLNAEEKITFEEKLKSDLVFAEAYNKHKTLLQALNAHEQCINLKDVLTTIHKQEFGNDAKIIPIKEETFIRKHGRTFAVAASVAVVAVIGTIMILSAGGYLLKQQSNAITDLKRDVTGLKYSQDAIIEGLKVAARKPNKIYAPANIEGTGFALNTKGYFITSYHMVRNADSVFVTNSALGRSAAKLITSNPSLDIAIYKIDNAETLETLNFPFSFKDNVSEIGDKVFTLGYPRHDVVYGEGSLSSTTGFNNDTTMYQISIPVNPGNSGGPLMDEYGNVIGVIRGKQTSAEATGFAIKASYIKQTIENITDTDTKKELTLTTNKSKLKGLKRSEQIKKIQPFVFNVMVYKK